MHGVALCWQDMIIKTTGNANNNFFIYFYLSFGREFTYFRKDKQAYGHRIRKFRILTEADIFEVCLAIPITRKMINFAEMTISTMKFLHIHQ